MARPSFPSQQRPAASLALMLAILLPLTACVNKGFPPQPGPAPELRLLTGNWLITGAVNPSLSVPPITGISLPTSLTIMGNQVRGQGFLTVPCGSFSTNVSFTGSVTPDGHLDAALNPLGSGQVAPVVTMTALAPTAATPETWSGDLTVGAITGCSNLSTVHFTAQPIAPVTGTYVGKAQPTFSLAGQVGTSFSVNLVQGSELVGQIFQTDTFYLPLTGNITVVGSPCFRTGVSSQFISGPGFVGGSDVRAYFTMDDGSELDVFGSLTDTTATTIASAVITVTGGNCDQARSFATLIRQ